MDIQQLATVVGVHTTLQEKRYRMTVWIFACDDDPRFLNLLDIIFQKDQVKNYKLFDNAEEMVAQVNEDVGVIVIDDNMGYVRGLTIVRRIVEKYKDNILYNPYFIILSNNKSGEIVQEYTNTGAIYRYYMKTDPHYKFTNAVKDAYQLALKQAEIRERVNNAMGE